MVSGLEYTDPNLKQGLVTYWDRWAKLEFPKTSAGHMK